MNALVSQIAHLVGGTVAGDGSLRITGVNGIKQAKAGQLAFLENPRLIPFLEATEATAVLVTPEVSHDGRTLIRVKNPYLSFLSVVREYRLGEPPGVPVGVHAQAVVGANVTLGKDVAIDAFVRIGDDCAIGDRAVIHAGVYIGEKSVIGPGTVLYPNVTVREGTVTGARCIIHAGAVLGSDGFGFVPHEGKLVKVPQTGNVVLGDDVEIGTNSAVDRATFGSTVIGRGTKIDNLVQIGHNVSIGADCVISGMSGVAGSTTIGDRVTIAAQVGVIDHLEIGDGATIAARAGVATNLKAGQVVSGFPAIDHKAQMRILAAMRQLPDMVHRVRELEQRIQQLEEQLHEKRTIGH